MGKRKILIFLSGISVVTVFSLLLWPAIRVEWRYECSEYTITTEYQDEFGQTGTRTTTGYICGWNEYWYWDDPPEGGGGGGEPQEPGGGGGGGQQNIYDQNHDGFIDCWRNTLIRLDNLVITQEFSDAHGGIDFGTIPADAIMNQPVYSAVNGTVNDVAANASGAGGWWIEIKDASGGIWTYCHLAEQPSLQNGASVVAGMTVIGKADNTGWASSGPHLHFQYKVDGVVQNPFNKIGDC